MLSINCKGIGGEKASLAVKYSQSKAFGNSGYADIQVNGSYIGGQVRQHGNYSFARVYQAGNQVPAYQPETSYQIFQRAIRGLDIATGRLSTTSSSGVIYSTGGNLTASLTLQDTPEPPKPTCYILDLFFCRDDAYYAVVEGSALIQDYIVIDENTEDLFPGVWNGTSYDNGSGFRFKELGKGDPSGGDAQGRDGNGPTQPSSTKGASTGTAAEGSRPRLAALALMLGLVGFGVVWW